MPLKSIDSKNNTIKKMEYDYCKVQSILIPHLKEYIQKDYGTIVSNRIFPNYIFVKNIVLMTIPLYHRNSNVFTFM